MIQDILVHFDPEGHMFYTGLHKKSLKKIFLSKPSRPRALIDIWYIASSSEPLPSLFKLGHAARNGLALGVTYFTYAYTCIGKHVSNLKRSLLTRTLIKSKNYTYVLIII